MSETGQQAWAVIAGYVLASGFGGLIITYVASTVARQSLKRMPADDVERDRVVAGGIIVYRPPMDVILLGVVERVLFTSAVWLGQFAFIGVWLALKGIAQWSAWQTNRILFNVYLIGTGVSLGFGVLGGLIVRELWPE